ncbi:MAG: hypothetical protein J0I23_28345 [Rhizobiales bacterium]|nr:hypothetical protein [Hyphomicrobiales bacterium]
MTTTITVKAGHGWPVRVQGIDPHTSEDIPMYSGLVAAGETRDFICHSAMDLRIHEIQPDEVAAEKAATDATTAA